MGAAAPNGSAPVTYAFDGAFRRKLHQDYMHNWLGDDLCEARRALGLTEAELASRVKCVVLTVRKAESGGNTLSRVQTLANACGAEIFARALPPGQYLGALLIALRTRQGHGRRAAAALAGLSPTTVAALERDGESYTNEAARLAEALGATLRLKSPGISSSFWDGAAMSSACHGWSKPPALLDALYAVVGGVFNLDLCSPFRRGAKAPARAKVRFTAWDNALTRPWRGTVFMNPPNGRQLGAWIAKARGEQGSGRAGFVVALVPARTDTRWWHDNIARAADVWMLKGRLAFGGRTTTAPFPSAIVVWGATVTQRAALCSALPEAWHISALDPCQIPRRKSVGEPTNTSLPAAGDLV